MLPVLEVVDVLDDGVALVPAGYGVVPATVGAALPLLVGALAGPLLVAVPPAGVAPRPVPVPAALLVPALLVVEGMLLVLLVPVLGMVDVVVVVVELEGVLP